MKKKYMHIVGLLLLIFLLVIESGPVLCAAEHELQTRPRTLKVAFPQSTGINENYEDGTYGGCVYDWLEEIAKYTGWDYEFVDGDADELMDALAQGEYDLMGGMFYVPGWADAYDYPKYIMGSNYSLLIYRRDNPDIKGYDITTLNGKTIGVLKRASSKIERLNKFLEFNNIQCELIYYDDTDTYEKCLKNRETDLLLGSDVYMTDDYNVAAKFPGESYYIVTARDEPELCDELTQAMEAIYAANPNFAEELYNKYFPERYINSITFTEQEQDFIENSGTLKVAVVKDSYPLFYKREGVIEGIVPECVNLISQRTGLAFEYVCTDTYQGMLNLVLEGKADLIGSYFNRNASAAEMGLARTVSYVSLDSVILRNKQSLGKNGERVMAVASGRDTEPESGSDTIRYYAGYQECLNAVNRGDADYTQMPAAFIEDFYSKDYYANITLAADTNLHEQLTMALPVPVEVPLYSVLSKALNTISEEESDRILSQNSLALPKNVTLKTLFYTNPVMVISIICMISAAVVLLNIYRMRARFMRVKLDEAVATNKAKSDFLSRMSHEIRTPMNAIIGLTNLVRMSGETTPAVDSSLAKIDSSAKFLLSLINDVLDMSKIESEKMKIENAPFDLRAITEQLESMFAIQAESRGIKLELECNLEDTCFIGDKMRLQQVLTNLLSNACKFTDCGGSIRLAIEEQSRTGQLAAIRFSVKDTGIGIRSEDAERIFSAFEQAKDSNNRAPGTGLGLAISSSLVSLMGAELKVVSEAGAGSEFYFTVTLPVTEAVQPAGDSARIRSDFDLRGLHILLAEDNDLNAEIAIELLKMKDITVDRAADGQQAADLFAASREGFYNAILMDINMPVKDGLTASKEIRAMGRTDARTVPILAMTANTFQEDRDVAFNAGMTGFLSKPFEVEQLYQILAESQEQACTEEKAVDYDDSAKDR